MFMSYSSRVERNEIFRVFPVTMAQCLECCVNKNTYAVRRRFGDFSNLLIAELVLKFQSQHFLLTRRQGGNDPNEKAGGFLLLNALVRHWLAIFLRLDRFFLPIH